MKKSNTKSSLIIKALASKQALFVIIVFFILQSAWIAVSFQYPMVFDESFHVPVIQLYSHQYSPLIQNQPIEYDRLGDLSHGASTTYHYLMSFPYRLSGLFTDSVGARVVLLRLINILFVAAGILFFAKLFRSINIRQQYINIGLGIFTLIPLVPLISAHVNYDNLLFLIVSLYLLTMIKVIQSLSIQWHNFASMILLGVFASLVKFSFLPLFVLTLAYVLVMKLRQHKNKFFPKLVFSLRKAPKKSLVFALVGFILVGGLFSATYLRNFAEFGSPVPSCTKTIGVQRCSSNPIYKRGQIASQTKDQRKPLSLSEASNAWVVRILASSTSTTGRYHLTIERKDPLPIMRAVVFFGAILSFCFLLYAWRMMPKSQSLYFLIFTAVAQILLLFIFNMSTYYRVHEFYAVQPRYLLLVAPIILILTTMAVGYSLKSRNIKLVILGISIILFTQGGGVLTHIVRSEPNWYWQNNVILNTNNVLQNISKPLIRENYGKYGI